MPDVRPELLLLPGLGLGREAWAPTVTAPVTGAAFRYVEVLPLPGYGLRAPAGADLSPERLAVDVVARLPEGRRTVLVGHSASCQVAVHAAALAPRSVAALVLVGPTTDPRARSWLRLARRWVATAAHERPEQVPSLVRQYHRTTLATMARAMEAARRESIEARLPAVRCEVYVVRGTHDRICPPDWAARLGRTTTLPVGAHMVPHTHGTLMAEHLAEVTHRI